MLCELIGSDIQGGNALNFVSNKKKLPHTWYNWELDTAEKTPPLW
jgi:hypothetical protein